MIWLNKNINKTLLTIVLHFDSSVHFLDKIIWKYITMNVNWPQVLHFDLGSQSLIKTSQENFCTFWISSWLSLSISPYHIWHQRFFIFYTFNNSKMPLCHFLQPKRLSNAHWSGTELKSSHLLAVLKLVDL